ncbi:MAG: carbohydrate kinase family protein [Verrucomicrobia bacterium]|jgi:sugar/nucleoside kinase (ribokinase family)|nr:carbohydrate kinase family protein [Verrucomicrobiota bacterium]
MSASNALQVVVAGHICLDVIPAFRKTDRAKIADLFIPGKLINMGAVKVSTGGPVSNTGIALSILGIRTALMGKIGDDFFGDGVLRLLSERGLNGGMVVMPGEQTSYTVVIVPPGVDRIFLHNPGANDTFGADDINYDVVKRARLFHFGYPPLMRRIYEDEGAELARIFERVKALGVTTSLDLSLPDATSDSGRVNWERVLERVLPHVDICIPSIEESLFMIRRAEFEKLNRDAHGHDLLEKLDLGLLPEVGAQLAAYGPPITVLKCGVKGYYIRTGERAALERMGAAKPADLDNWAGRELHEESFHVPQVASATGSGDSSIAGFLAAFLNGQSIEDAIRIACAVGGQNVRVFDAISGIHSWAETLAMIPGWDKNRLAGEGGYWTFDARLGQRVGQFDRSRRRGAP